MKVTVTGLSPEDALSIAQDVSSRVPKATVAIENEEVPPHVHVIFDGRCRRCGKPGTVMSA